MAGIDPFRSRTAKGSTDDGLLIEAGTTDSDGLLTFRYGIDGDGNPYFDVDGAPLTEAARLFLDPDVATFYLEAML